MEDDFNSNSDSDDDRGKPNKKYNKMTDKKRSDKSCEKVHAKNCDKDEHKNGELCAICLGNMDKDIGSPDLCDHSFCLECILEWAKTNNSCPKDRITFLQVFARRRIGGKIIKVIPIQQVKPVDIPDDEDDVTFCEICGRSDREDILLLCDGCDSGYHLDCLTPQLSQVPVDEWFCPECVNIGDSRHSTEETDIDFNEVETLLHDGAAIARNLPARRRPHSPRALPRTRESVRVRARIARARISRAARNESFSEQLMTDDASLSDLAVPSTSRVASSRKITKIKKPTKRRVVRRKTTKKKRKVTKKRKTTKTATKGKKRKKRRTKTTTRRRVKGKVRRSAKRIGGRRGTLKRLKRNNVISTPKSRIAEVLGITSKNHPWQLSLPAMKQPKESFASSVSNLRMQKYNAGVPSLSLLGSNSEFDYVNECDFDTEGGDGLLVPVRRNLAPGDAALARRKAANLLMTVPSSRRQRPSLSSRPSANILDSIIENQENLLRRQCSVDDYGNVNWLGEKVNVSKAKANVKESANGETKSRDGRPQGGSESRENRNGDQAGVQSVHAGGKDPTGAEAYSSYLRDRRQSEGTTDYQPIKSVSEPSKKKNSDKTEDDVDLYSDVEPEAWDELESLSPEYDDTKVQNRNEQDDDVSSADDLIIDDSVNTDVNRNPACDSISREQCTTALPGMKEYDEFGLEEVSDAEVQELEKSPNSSISFSDSNMEDVEVVNCAEEAKENNTNVGMGLDGLEVEVISDSEESCFEDENIEEGEIYCDTPATLPLNRPRINMQFRKPLEMIASSKEFEGDYEEGEIVDESALKKDKRDKAKEEVDKVVNQPLDDESEELVNNSFGSDVVTPCKNIVNNDTSVEEKEPPCKPRNDESENDSEKPAKEPQAEKKQDISFKKISKNTKVRNYRDNEKDTHSKSKESKERGKEDKVLKEKKRKRSPERNQKDHNKKKRVRSKDKDRDKKREPKRKEMARYNVRQMITKKEEERKKKDEFGRDVSLRDDRSSRSRTPHRHSSRSRRRSRSRSSRRRRRSTSRKSNWRKRKRSYSSSSSSSSSSSTSSSFSSSSTSSSRSSSSSPPRKHRRKSDPKVAKKVDKKKEILKPKERPKVVLPPASKKENKKEKFSDSEEIKIEKIKKKRKREKSPLQSKEVFQSGGSIMVSVNFARKQAKEAKEKKKKEKEVKSELAGKFKPPAESPDHSAFIWGSGVGSPTGKRTPLQDEPMWSPENLKQQDKGAVSPDMRDNDIIMVTPPPQEPILISDSEDEGITRLPPDLGAKPISPQMRNQGPKTPPDPGVKFTLSTKQNLKPINNPLGEEEERQLTIPIRGPNTPPGPPPESDESGGRVKSPRMPHSPGGSQINSSPEPDVYDPFEPTKSPSPRPSPQQPPAREISKETIEINDSPEKDASPSYSSDNSQSTPPPPLPSEPPEPEEKPPEPQKPPEEEPRPPPSSITVVKSSNAPSTIAANIAHPPTCIPALFPISTIPLTQNATIMAQPVAPMQQLFASLPPNVANILYPAAMAAVRGAAGTLLCPPIVQPILTPDLSRPPPSTGLMPHVPMVLNNNAQKPRPNQNGKSFLGDFIDMDVGSPTSPDSSDASDIFEPPSPHRHTNDKISPRKQRSVIQKKPDRFDTLFGNESRTIKTPQKSKPSTPSKTPVKCSGKLAAELDAEIPSSAVELQVKEKFLKKIQRQERVVEEVKVCLKPYYNKKTINKEDYKDIMKKCVQKICHNKSGEINPIKIRSLVDGYIKKVKYYRKKFGSAKSSAAPPGVSDPPAPGFTISKAHPGKVKP